MGDAERLARLLYEAQTDYQCGVYPHLASLRLPWDTPYELGVEFRPRWLAVAESLLAAGVRLPETKEAGHAGG